MTGNIYGLTLNHTIITIFIHNKLMLILVTMPNGWLILQKSLSTDKKMLFLLQRELFR